MAKTYIGGSQSVTTAANETSFWPLGGELNKSAGSETSKQILFRSAGTLSNLYCRVTANSIPTTASTFRTRDNTANGGQSVSIGVTTTGEFTDSSGTDTVAAGDKLNYQFVPGAATGTLTFSIQSCIFEATGDPVTRLIVNDNVNKTTASTTWFLPLSGSQVTNTTTEANAKIRQRKAGTLKNACVRVTAARATATTVKSRKNGADGNLSVSCTAATTGFFEDTSNSDTISAGEDWNWALTTGTGVDTLTVQYIAADFVSVLGDGQVINSTMTPLAYTDATTRFSPISGRLQTAATEADTKADCRIAGDYSELTCLVTQNGVTAASSIVLRKNGADTALVCSITASTTGVFSDSTHTVTLVSTDEVNYSIVAPSVAGTQTVTIANIIMYITVVSRISLSRIYKYNVLGRISLSRIYKWDVVVSLTRISLSRVYKYNVLSRTSLSRIYKYHVLGRVSLARIYKYNVIGRISLTRVYKWNVLQRISLARIYKYHVLGRISLSRIYRYNVLLRISLSRIYKYNVLARVSLSRIYKYNLIGRVSLARIYKWNVGALTRISLSRIYKYNVQARVSLARNYKYNIIGRITLSRIYKYSMLGRVSLARVYKYNVIQRISASKVYKWNVIQRVSLARIYKWNVIVAGLTRISLSRIYKWNTQARVSLPRVYKYNVLNRISLARIYKYHLLQRISLSRVYKWNLIALFRVSKQQIIKYNIIGRVSKQVRLKWNLATLAITQWGKIREWIYARYSETDPSKQ